MYIIIVMCIFIYYLFIMLYVYQVAGWPSIALFSKYLDEHRCFGSGFCHAIWYCADSFQMLSNVITSIICLLCFKHETVSSSSQWFCSSKCLLTCFVPGFCFVSFTWAMEEFSSPEAAFVLTLNLVSVPPLRYCSSLWKIPVIFDFLREIGMFTKYEACYGSVCVKHF